MGSKPAGQPIAIVGIGCRFPSSGNTPRTFWEMLCSETDGISDIPPDRWNSDMYYSPDKEKAGFMQIRQGGFIKDIDLFDAHFFNISPREANYIDPQQRILLEVAWESLEDAGCIPSRLAGSETGVFIGKFATEYHLMHLAKSERELIGPHSSTGTLSTLLSNRISHWFDFRGPSISIDTACSSSLVAVHLACQSIWNNESSLALAGGVNIILKPEWTLAAAKGGFLSEDGRCKTFDTTANGYVRSEGAGVIVLKPLAAALEDGDRIYALIRGSGSNQDGHTQGITVPSAASQRKLVETVYQQAGIAPKQVSYIEAHGTGTAVGDPIEANAMGSFFSQGRGRNETCFIGSVKSNIGHMEAAAGVGGLIKAALCLHYEKIPPNIHFNTPNPAIDFEALKLKVPQKLEAFPQYNGSCFACVNSFGFGGTNAHVLLERFNAPVTEEKKPDVHREENSIYFLSARSDEALTGLIHAHLDLLKDKEHPLHGLCSNLIHRREHHNHRLAVTGKTKEEILNKLRKYLQEGKGSAVFRHSVTLKERLKPAFVFSGMGPQWWGMGRELLQQESLFREKIKECDHLLSRYADWSLWDELTAEEHHSRIDETRIAQPALFAVQVALAALWHSRGVSPGMIIGHSAGEIAAAHTAGALSLEDAVCIICHRSRLQHTTEGEGRIMAVGLSAEEAEKVVRDFNNRICIGAVNSPQSVALVGDTDVLEEVKTVLEQRDIFCRIIHGKVPYHSPKMDRLKDDLIASLQKIRPRKTTVPLISTVTGGQIDGTTLTPEYWFRNIRETVQFEKGLKEVIRSGFHTFLELSPHPVLSSSVSETLSHLKVTGEVIPSLRRKKPEADSLTEGLARLLTTGCEIERDKLCPQKGRFIQLPPYPWQRKRYWVETEYSRNLRTGEGEPLQPATGKEVHPLLGGRFNLAYPAWEKALSLDSLSYIRDHQVAGNILFPGAGYVEMALASAGQIYNSGSFRLESIEFQRPLFIAEGQKVSLQLIHNPQDMQKKKGETSFSIFSRAAKGKSRWQQHCTGKIQKPDNLPAEKADGDKIRKRCSVPHSKEECYQRFKKRGLEYGTLFQGIESLFTGEHEATGTISIDGSLLKSLPDYFLHPSLLDACFQVFLGALSSSDTKEASASRIYLPVRVEHLSCYRRPEGRLQCHAKLTEKSDRSVRGDILLFNSSGEILVRIEGFTCKALDDIQEAPLQQMNKNLFAYKWIRNEKEPPVHTPLQKRGTWLLYADSEGVADALSARLKQEGETPLMIFPGNCFQEISTLSFQVRPDSAEDAEALLTTVLKKHPPCRGIIHLWSLNAPSGEGYSLKELEAFSQMNYSGILHLIQCLSRKLKGQPPHLMLITDRAEQVDKKEAPLSFEQAGLWGLGRVIMSEHPEFSTRLIDINTKNNFNLPALFHTVLSAAEGEQTEDELAIRGATLYRHRLERLVPDFSEEESITLHAEGTYVVTGGLKGFGLATAQWLVQCGARYLVLLGRSKVISAEAEEALQKMKQHGVQVMVIQTDVTDRQQLSEAFLQIRKNMPALKGVFHSANVYQDAMLLQMDTASFMKVLKPKAFGAWNLHRETLQDKPDLFVLYSSISLIIGNAGQSNYVTANAFLDAFSHYRHSIGLPCLSVNWGAIEDVGYVAQQNDVATHLKRSGMMPIPSRTALKGLGALLTTGLANVAFAEVDWKKWSTTSDAGRSPKFSSVLTGTQGEPVTTTASPSSQEEGRFLNAVQALPSGQRKEQLTSYLQVCVAEVLGISDPEEIDVCAGLSDTGLDSMLSNELRLHIQKYFACTLPQTVFFKYPNIEKLSEHLFSELFQEEEQNNEGTEATTSPDSPDELSEEELARELLKTLSSIKEDKDA